VYKKFVAHGERQISTRYRERISQLQESEDQRTQLLRFYKRHSAFFSKEVGRGKEIELHAPKEAAEFLRTLAFDVLGSGNVSQISRLLMYHFAMKRRWLKAPRYERATKPAIERPDTGARRVIPVAAMPDKRSGGRPQKLSVNSLFTGHESTEQDLTALARLMRLAKSAVLRYLIDQAAEGTTPKKIRTFYEKRWAQEDGLQLGLVRIRYRISRKQDQILDMLAHTIVGEHSRSMTLRTIIAYNAVKYKVRP
jgi:hypothetical protein